jgi:hypothetical protein
MSEPWIRVHANIAAKPIVWRAVESLGISQPEAVGLLVTFWGAVSQHAPNGAVSQFPDAQIEAWAGWTRKRGRFAAFIREMHVDGDGRVNEWDEYAGALEEQRRQARERKRRSRGGHSDIDVTDAGSSRTSSPTIRDDTIEQSVNPVAAEAEAGFATLLETDRDRNALTVVLRRAKSPVLCVASIDAMRQGMDLKGIPTMAEMGSALRDYASNGGEFNAAHFRGYVTRAMRARDVDPSRPGGSGRNGRGSSGTNPGAQQVANILGGHRD